MEDVPARPHSRMPVHTRIVISESINQFVPKGVELSDKQRFTEWNPNIVDDQGSAEKVRYVQVFRFFNAAHMLHDPPEKYGSRARFQICTLTASLRNCFTYIYGRLKITLRIIACD